MSLLKNNKRYTRPQTTDTTALHTTNLIGVLENEAYNLVGELSEIEEAKSREHDLRLRLNVVQQSLQAFRALETPSEPVQEQLECLPIPQEKRVRKAVTKSPKVRETTPKKLGEPLGRGIANGEHIKDNENIELVHDDFSTFPE